jgi:glyoxylase-like metal-dependent hydrolase (beta-lactamase superfamily II)
MTTTSPDSDVRIGGLWASTPQSLPFAPALAVRAFLLERPAGNLLIYSTGNLAADAAAIQARGGATRQYLNHWHEALWGTAPAELGARLVHHEAEAAEVARRGGHGASFSHGFTLGDDFEAIPIPGHTPGATAYLWDTGEHRLLFTGDSVYLNDGEWVDGLLDSSDRDAYLASLALIRDLDFDVLVPWAASAGQPYASVVTPAQRRARIDALIQKLSA